MAVSCDEHCVIGKLLQTPFTSLSYNVKHNINLHTKIKTCTRHYTSNTNLYEAIPWLCGCAKLNYSGVPVTSFLKKNMGEAE
jgi:hypothetical protein